MKNRNNTTVCSIYLLLVHELDWVKKSNTLVEYVNERKRNETHNDERSQSNWTYSIAVSYFHIVCAREQVSERVCVSVCGIMCTGPFVICLVARKQCLWLCYWFVWTIRHRSAKHVTAAIDVVCLRLWYFKYDLTLMHARKHTHTDRHKTHICAIHTR